MTDDQRTPAAKAWADLEFAASATGALEVANVTLPIEKVRALVAERVSALPSSPVSELVERMETCSVATFPIVQEATSTLTTLSTRNAELEREVKRLREALEFYADTSKYPAPFTGGFGELYYDCGQIARRALSTSPQGGEHE